MSGLPQERIVRFVRDPQLQQIELRYSHYAENAFSRHAHETYAIGMVQNGQTLFTRCTSQEEIYRVKRHDIVLINPGEVHACNPQPGSSLTYYMLYIAPAFMNEIGSAFQSKDAGQFVFQQPVVQNMPLFNALIDLCRAMFQHTGRLEIESHLFETLSELAINYGALKPDPYPPSATEMALMKSRDFLQEHLTGDLPLHELAEIAGLSPYYFIRAFRARFGLPPHTYQLQQRIHLAKRLLAEGQSIASVSAETGFADQSHFTRKFKTLVGATPHQYQHGNTQNSPE